MPHASSPVARLPKEAAHTWQHPFWMPTSGPSQDLSRESGDQRSRTAFRYIESWSQDDNLGLRPKLVCTAGNLVRFDRALGKPSPGTPSPSRVGTSVALFCLCVSHSRARCSCHPPAHFDLARECPPTCLQSGVMGRKVRWPLAPSLMTWPVRSLARPAAASTPGHRILPTRQGSPRGCLDRKASQICAVPSAARSGGGFLGWVRASVELATACRFRLGLLPPVVAAASSGLLRVEPQLRGVMPLLATGT